MLRDPTMLALARCGQEVVAAANGHHRRWALKRCTDALVAAGTLPGLADKSARAMAAVAESIRQGAAAASTPAGA